MSKDIDEEGGAKNAVTELLDMMASIRAIKGTRYAACIRVLFATTNFTFATKGNEAIMPEALKAEHRALMLGAEASLKDLCDIIIRLYVEACKKYDTSTKEAFEAAYLAVATEMQADLEMLNKKQTEYEVVMVGGKSNGGEA